MFLLDLLHRLLPEIILYFLNKKHGTEDVIKMIIGNKCDMDNREVTIDRLETLCIKYGIPFFEVSAKLGLNIEESFSEMTLRILEQV